MKILFKIFGVVVVLAAIVFAAALWLMRVPAIETNEAGLQGSLKIWFDKRYGGTVSQFNGAAIVVKDGSILLRDSWGQDGDSRPLSTVSQFRLASVSKSFTAAAVLQLADNGKVNLDLPIREQMQDCEVDATPAELLRHRSGLPDGYMERANIAETLTLAKAVKGICESGADAITTDDYHYNNSGYVLLAGFVEEKSGMSFEKFMDKEILTPLGLNRTRVWNLESSDAFVNRATGFDRDGKIEPSYLDGVAGDGAVFSTVDDLRNWAKFWLDDRLISRDLKDRAIGRNLGDGYHFGLFREGNHLGHGGSWLGASTYFGFRDSEKHEDVVVLLDNGSSIFVNEMQEEVWRSIN